VHEVDQTGGQREPDRPCFVCVEYEQRDNLEHTFQWSGFRNGYSETRAPPNIELNFHDKCA